MSDPRPREPESEDDFVPARTIVADIDEAVDTGDAARLDDLLEPLHPADIADVIEQLTPRRRGEFVRLYSREIDGEILSEIDESIRDEVIEALPDHVLADAVR